MKMVNSKKIFVTFLGVVLLLLGYSLINQKENINIIEEEKNIELIESALAEDEIFDNGSNSIVAGELKYSYEYSDLSISNEDSALVKPKIGYQMAYNNDGTKVSIRYTAAIASLDVSATWTRATYDSEGNIYHKESNIPVKVAYTGLTSAGTVRFAENEVDEYGNRPYKYYVVYSLLEIPVDRFGTYFLDASLTIKNNNGSISSLVGAVEFNNTKVFTYERGTIENLKFTINEENKSFSVTGNNKYTDEVVIPGYYSDGEHRYIVNEINDEAFKNYSNLLYLEIPKTIDKVGDNVLFGASNVHVLNRSLKPSENWSSIWNPNNRPIIYGYTGYKEEINGIIYTISKDENSTYYASVLGYNSKIGYDVIIENNIRNVDVTKIVDYAFYYCDYINTIEISENITSIGSYSFFANNNLKNIKIPSNLKNIGDNAFAECYSLENVYYNGAISEYCGILFENEKSNPAIIAKNIKVLNENEEYDNIITNFVAATCEAQGYTSYSFGEVTIYDDYISELGHLYNGFVSNGDGTHSKVCEHDKTHKETFDCEFGDWILVTPANCLTDGVEQRLCECGHVETRYIESHGHEGKKTIIEPTCTKDGYTINECISCGNTYISDYIYATGHSYGDWIISLEATCTENGEMYKQCENCEQKIESTIYATGHSYILVNTTADSEGTTYHYECEKCNNSFTSFKEDVEENVTNLYVDDCDVDFSFTIITEQSEEYIRENLFIFDSYYLDNEELLCEDVYLSYELSYLENNKWLVVLVNELDYDSTYHIKISDKIAFEDYKAESLTIKTINNENHLDVIDFKDDLKFLKTLEINNPGYYPYELMTSAESEYLYLIINKIDDLEIGDLLFIGDIESTEEINEDNASEIYIGKISEINKTYDGRYLVELEEPLLAEVFDKLDISYEDYVNFDNMNISTEELSNEIVDELYNNDDFLVFISAVNVAADSYLSARHLDKQYLKSEAYLENIKIDPDIQILGTKMKININGSINIPIKTNDGKSLGNISVSFAFKAHVEIKINADYKLKYFLFVPTGIEYIDLNVTQSDSISFDFNVSINCDYKAYKDQKDEDLVYAYNKEYGVVHNKDCVHVVYAKDPSKYNYLNVNEIMDLIKTNTYFYKQCELCHPIDDVLKNAYVKDMRDHTFHTFNCSHVGDTIEFYHLITLDSADDIIAAGIYAPCEKCNPDKKDEIEFELKLEEAFEYKDWKQTFNEIKNLTISNNTKSGDNNSTKVKEGISIGSYNVVIAYIFNVKVDVRYVFDFDLQASLKYSYSYAHESVYGLRIEDGNANTYHTSKEEVEKNELEIKGQVHLKTGFEIDVSAELVIIGKWANAGISAGLYVYVDAAGIYKNDFTNGLDAEYAVAYFEAGLIVDINAHYKLIIWEDNVDIWDTQIVLLKLGYDKSYYSFAQYLDEIDINNTYDIEKEGILKVNYIDLKDNFKEGQAYLSLAGVEGQYYINVSLANGDYCEIKDGVIVYKENAPCVFNDQLIIEVVSISDFINYKKNNSDYSNLGTYTININYYVDCAHNYGTQNIDDIYLKDEATCYSLATYYHSCSLCGKAGTTTFEYGDYLPHLYSDDFTCHDRNCLNCEHIELATTEHRYTDWILIESSGCSINDYNVRVCQDCHYIEYDGEHTGVEHPHLFSEKVTVNPTCESEGYYLLVCENCGAELINETIPALGHNLNLIHDAEGHQYICTRDGCDYETEFEYHISSGNANCEDDEICTECYYVITEAYGHNWSNDYRADNNYHWRYCTNDNCSETIDMRLHYGGVASCSEHALCGVCGHEYGSFKSHVYNQKVVLDIYLASDATCTNKAEYYYSCKCGKVGTTTFKYGTSLGHSHILKEIVDPTCTEKGYTLYECHCGDTYKTNYIDETPHSYGEYQKDITPTLYSTGRLIRYCDDCGRPSYYTLPKLNETNYSLVVTDMPTCKYDGEGVYSITIGSQTFEYIGKISKIGHDYTNNEWVLGIEPTIESKGSLLTYCNVCGEEYVSELPKLNNRDYTYSIQTPATCTKDGVGVYTYTTINRQEFNFEVVIPASHNYSIEVTYPTCEEQGYTEHKCENCGHTYKDNYTDPLGHSYGEWKVYNNPTEESKGLLVRICANDEDHKETFTLPKLNSSDYIFNIELEPTCTKDGIKSYIYFVDGEEFKFSIIISKIGHSYGEWKVYNNPTEESKGLLIRICANDEDHEETFTLPKLNEVNYLYEVSKEATCTENGVGVYTYVKDGQTFEFEVEIIASHSYGEWEVNVEPTEDSLGLLIKVCDVCEDEKEHTLPSLNKLDYTYSIKTPATCTENGIGTYKYTIDNQVFNFDTVLLSTGHNYIDKVIEPTCEEQGYTEHKCENCGHTYKDNYTDPLGHSYEEWKVYNNPTEENSGYLIKICENNKDHTVKHVLPILNEVDYSYEVEVAATCTENGVGVYTYVKDGQTFEFEVVIPARHSYGEWEVSVEPTEDSLGLLIKVCDVCEDEKEHTLPSLNKVDYTYSIKTPASCTEDGIGTYKYTIGNQAFNFDTVILSTGHNYIDKVIEPTCEEQGYTEHKCENCGHAYKDNYTDPLGHSYGEWKVKEEPTEENSGYLIKVCENNKDHTVKHLLPILNEVDYSYEVEVAATCTEDGIGVYTYTIDGQTFEFEVVIPASHSYGEYITTKYPTCSEEGEKTATCEVCGEEDKKPIPVINHNYGVLHEEVDSTCTSEGHIAYYQCSMCYNYFDVNKNEVNNIIIPIKDHNYGEWHTIIEPTCLDKGLREKVCEDCGHYITEDIDSLGHKESSTYVFNETSHWKECIREDCDARINETIHSGGHASCEGHGLCSVCQYAYLDPLGHDYQTEWSYNSIEHYHKCSNCDSIVDSEEHIFEVITETTSEENGKDITYTHNIYNSCIICEYKEYLATITDEEHNSIELIQPLQPTCTEEGHTYGIKCTTCNEMIIETEILPALGHDNENCRCERCGEIVDETKHKYHEEIVEPTCTSEGYTMLICDECGHKEKVNITNPTEHNYIVESVIEPTCEEQGYTVYKCQCGDSYFGNYVEALEHNYLVESVIEPSCEEQGYTIYRCKCGDSYIGDYIEATGHKFVEEITEPTCENSGYINYICEICNHFSHEKSQSIDPLGHDYVNGICSRCGDVDEENISLEFKLSDDGSYYIVVGSHSDAITIPAYYKGLPVTKIDVSAFINNYNLQTLILPETINEINPYGFINCNNIYSISIHEDNPYFMAKDNVIYNKDGTILIVNLSKNVESFIIPDHVKFIGEAAFYQNYSLTSVTLHNNIEGVGEFAFGYCNNLSSINLPKNMKFIDSFAFYSCALKEITIPEGIRAIEDGTFMYCNSLESITLPSTIETIYYSAFSGTYNLANVYYSGTLEDGCNINYVMSNNQTFIIQHFYMLDENNEWYEVTSIEIPNSIKEINDYQFNGFAGIQSFVIPDSVTTIGNYAFANNYSLTDITLSKNITNIGMLAFAECNSLENVYYKGTIEDWCNIRFDSEYSNPMYYAKHFYMLDENNEWYEVTSIEIPNTISSINNQFIGFSNLTDIVIPEGVTSIGEWSFYYCQNLKNITIPSSVSTIGYGAFGYLENVYYKGTIEDWCNIMFADVSSNPMSAAQNFYMLDENNEWYEVTSIEIPNTITTIGNYQFAGFTCIENILLHNGLTSIGSGAFYYCTNITEVTIPESVSVIGPNAFAYCSNMTNVIISEGVTSVGSGAFSYCSNLIDIKLADTISSIERLAFRNCISLETITLPRDLYSIGDAVFYGCSKLENILIDENNENYKIRDNILFSKDGRTVVMCLVFDKTTYVIPSEVTVIADGAFANYTTLQEIIIPDGVTTIGNSAFLNCASLTNIVIPDSVNIIGKSAFYYCNNLISITLPFVGNIENGTENTHFGYIFGASSYYGQSSYIPGTLTKVVVTGENIVDENAFYGCSSIIEIELKNSIKIGQYALCECNSLTKLTIPFVGQTKEGMVNTEFSYIFGYDYNIPNSLNELIITDALLIADNAFLNCASLTNITIPNSVTSIGSDAFSGCSNLENVYYYGTIENWYTISLEGDYSNPMSACQHFYMLNENDEWYKISEVTNIEIPNTISLIGDYQFCGFENLESIIIPDSVTSIGRHAFYGCSSLENIYYEGTMENWCNIVFDDKYSNPMSTAEHFYMLNENKEWYEVTSIEIPNTITTIGAYQFYKFNNVTSITIPESVTSIESRAFEGGYSSLENVYYEGTIEDWCNIKFTLIDSNPMYYASHFYMLNENKEWYEVTSIEIPNTITTIGAYQFYGFDNVTSITIPDSVTKIENNSFAGCVSLSTITIGKSLVRINYGAFNKCSSLQSVYYNGTADEWNNIVFVDELSNPMYYAQLLICDGVIVIDNIAPTIIVESNIYVYASDDSYNLLENVVVEDNIDTNLTVVAYYNGVECEMLDISNKGTYIITYEAIDTFGNKTTVTSTIVVKDNYVTSPQIGTNYYMMVEQENTNQSLYFTGEMYKYYFASSESIDDAAVITLEIAEGGYYIKSNGNYVNIVLNGSYLNLKIQETSSTIWVWNSEYNTFVANCNSTEYILCASSSQTYINIGNIKYANNNFIVHLYLFDN